MTHDYKRHGTTTLFAALNVLNRKVVGQCMQEHRRQEYIRFLNAVEATCDAALARRGWRLAVTGEIVGAMNGVLSYLVSNLSERQQFGRALGSCQAPQHRVSELSVTLESSRFLALNAAAWADTDEMAALTGCYAANAAHVACLEARKA